MGSLSVWGRKTVTREGRGRSTSDTRSSEILTRPALLLIKLNSFQGTQVGFISYQVFTNTLDMECPPRNKKIHHVCPQEGNKMRVQLPRPCLGSKGQPALGVSSGRDRVNREGGSTQEAAFMASGHIWSPRLHKLPPSCTSFLVLLFNPET